MDYYYDIALDQFVDASGSNRPLRKLAFMRDEDTVMAIRLQTNGGTYTPDGTAALTFAIKQTAGETSTTLAIIEAADFTLSAGVYTGTLALNGEALSDLLGADFSLTLYAQLSITDNDGTIKSRVIPVVMSNDIIRGDEELGNMLPDSDTYVRARAVVYDAAQTLTSLQKAQVISNLALDADLATFTLPASTTISTFGASLVDDTDASAAQTTLGLGTAATSNTGDFAAASHAHVSADITNTTDDGVTNPGKILKTAVDGSLTIGTLYVIGTNNNISTSSTNGVIFTQGSAAHIYTSGGGDIRTTGAFKIEGGGFTTTLTGTQTADRAISFPNKSGTLATLDAETHTGAHAFSSATRPTSGGTGTPESTSLVTRSDVDSRGGRRLSAQLVADETGDDNTTTLKTSATLTLALEAGTWNIEALIIVNAGTGFATVGSRQKISFTGTGTFTGTHIYNAQNGSANSTTYPTTRAANAVDSEYPSSGNSTATLRLGRLVVTVPGSLVVQFAQRTAGSGSAPVLAVPSYIRAHLV